MASALENASTPVSLEVPLTQQTAPVLEFRCLYTSDIRKKVKKWQDGRLKYHTFNKKIMVWDERAHFIGETYWQDDNDFDDGEELHLERSGTMVEVGECVAKHETDLSDLVGKRLKEREIRAAMKTTHGASIKYPHAFLHDQEALPATTNPLPRPLNAILTTSGHYGRANMPQNSPFEQRRHGMNVIQPGQENERPAKRRKQEVPIAKNSYAQNLLGTRISLTSSKRSSMASTHYEPFKVKTSQQAPSIDLTADEETEDVRAYQRDSFHMTAQRKRTIKASNKGSSSTKERSGYASKLLGATISLTPSNGPPRRHDDARHISTSQDLSSPNPLLSRTTQIDFSINESSLNRRTTQHRSTLLGVPTPKAKQSSSTRDRISLTTQSSRIAEFHEPVRSETGKEEESPPIRTVTTEEDLMILSSEPSEVTFSKSAPTCSTLNLMESRPTSALRIKPRPRRKMMILMNRPSARPTVATNSTITKIPLSIQSDQDLMEPVLSQAALQLDAICRKQEEALRLRLDSPLAQETVEDRRSSLGLEGIDHQTIDLLIARQAPLSPRPSSKPIAVQIEPNISNIKADCRNVAIANNVKQCSIDSKRMVAKASASPQDANNLLASLSASMPDLISSCPIPGEMISESPPKLTSSAVDGTNEVVDSLDEQPRIESNSHDAKVQTKNKANIAASTMRLANPATRGKSLQRIAANTTEALNVVNMVLPPLPQIQNRVRRSQAMDESAMGASVQAKDEIVNGPWSRESFDLFGDWRAPGLEEVAGVAINR